MPAPAPGPPVCSKLTRGSLRTSFPATAYRWMSWWGEFPPSAVSPSQSGRPDAGAVSGYAGSMSPDQQPTNIQLAKRDDYRDNYANSVQVRMTMWDFFLTFGVMSDANSERV